MIRPHFFARLSCVAAPLLFAAAQAARAEEESHRAPSATAIAASGVMTEEKQDQTSPTLAYEWLKAGNERFRTGKPLARDLVTQREALAHSQHPYAAILSCMDSRTSVEYIFDANIGDLFSCRVAGNVVNDDILGSLEYATKVAGAKLIVVLGHSSCDAMEGAAENIVLGNLTALCARLKPALAAIPDDGQPRTGNNHDLIDRAARMNVIHTVRTIRDRSPVIRELHDRGQIDLIGAFYDLETGKVEFYRPLIGTAALRTTTTILKEPKKEAHGHAAHGDAPKADSEADAEEESKAHEDATAAGHQEPPSHDEHAAPAEPEGPAEEGAHAHSEH